MARVTVRSDFGAQENECSGLVSFSSLYIYTILFLLSSVW